MLLILTGPANAGKTAVARELRARDRRWAFIEMDMVLARILDASVEAPGAVLSDAYALVEVMATELLERGRNVLVESTFTLVEPASRSLHADRVESLRARASMVGAPSLVVQLLIDRDEALARSSSNGLSPELVSKIWACHAEGHLPDVIEVPTARQTPHALAEGVEALVDEQISAIRARARAAPPRRTST
jgi:chloramphenicol 3-O-phosphotransferase